MHTNQESLWAWGVTDHLAVFKSSINLRPNVEIDLIEGKYHILSARSIKHYLSVFKLRHDVFTSEYGLNPSLIPLDFDRFDALCDHIIIIDTQSNTMVGTYRVNCSLFGTRFYTQTEFNMDSFCELPGIKLELGRACIRKEYRNGKAIDLLWKGVSTYAKSVGARYLFGCSSVSGTDPIISYQVQSYLKEKGKLLDLNINPHKNYEFERPSGDICKVSQNDKVTNLLPPLLKSYLTAGATVAPNSALDRDFECFDFFTLLDITQMNPLFKKRYFR